MSVISECECDADGRTVNVLRTGGQTVNVSVIPECECDADERRANGDCDI